MKIQVDPIVNILLKANVVKSKSFSWNDIVRLLNPVHINERGCWIRGKDSTTYTRINIDNQSRLAHRISYEVFNGERIPNNKLGLHKCDVPACINPDHIYPGTDGQNWYDAQVAKRYTGTRIRSSNSVKDGRLVKRRNKLQVTNSRLRSKSLIKTDSIQKLRNKLDSLTKK